MSQKETTEATAIDATAAALREAIREGAGSLATDTLAWIGEPPWRRGLLACFSIVGMNHYYLPGRGRCLFVAMVRIDKCIKAEGEDGPELWAELERKAKEAVGDQHVAE